MHKDTYTASPSRPVAFAWLLVRAGGQWLWNVLLFKKFRILECGLSETVLIAGNCVALHWHIEGHSLLWIEGHGFTTASRGTKNIRVGKQGRFKIKVLRGFRTHRIDFLAKVDKVGLWAPLDPVTRFGAVKALNLQMPVRAKVSALRSNLSLLELKTKRLRVPTIGISLEVKPETAPKLQLRANPEAHLKSLNI